MLIRPPVSLNNTLPKPRSGGRFARLMMSRSSTEVIGLGVEGPKIGRLFTTLLAHPLTSATVLLQARRIVV